MDTAVRLNGPIVVLLSAVAALSLAGCGGSEIELGTVSGVVTLDGEPLRGVFVNFQPQGGTPSYGITDKDGRYEVSNVAGEGALLGQHEVYLEQLLPEDVAELAPELGGEPSKVPPKFQQPFQTVEIVAGDNEFNLELTSGG